MPADERIEKWEARIAKHEKELVGLDRDWRIFKRLFIPAFVLSFGLFFWKPVVAVFALFISGGYIFSSVWIVQVRTRETKEGLAEARAHVQALKEADAAAGAAAERGVA